MDKDIFDNLLERGDLIIHAAKAGSLIYSIVRDVSKDRIKVAYPVKITAGMYRIAKTQLRSAQTIKVPIETMQNWRFEELANEYRKLQENIKNGNLSI